MPEWPGPRTWGFLNWGGTLPEPPPVSWVTRTTTSAITTTAPPTRTPRRRRFCPRLRGALLGGALAGSRPCAGLSTCFDWSLGRQRSEPVPAKGINSLQGPRPFGGRLAGIAEGGRGLPEVPVDEGDGDEPAVLGVGELPGAGHAVRGPPVRRRRAVGPRRRGPPRRGGKEPPRGRPPHAGAAQRPTTGKGPDKSARRAAKKRSAARSRSAKAKNSGNTCSSRRRYMVM